MSDILDRIGAYKRQEVDTRRAAVSEADLQARVAAAPTVRSFRQALEQKSSQGRPALIAEIKKASPSKGLIRPDFDPPALALAYGAGGAACLSILTDAPSFGGSEAYLEAARSAVALPCLRKDFLVDAWQVAESRAHGADCILVIMAMVNDDLAAALMSQAARLGMDALVEVHDEAEMRRALDLKASLIGVNNRNLRTFEVDLATTERLAAMAGEEPLLVAESGIFTPADVARVAQAGARAMLVGESLMRQANVEAATRTLLGAAD